MKLQKYDLIVDRRRPETYRTPRLILKKQGDEYLVWTGQTVFFMSTSYIATEYVLSSSETIKKKFIESYKNELGFNPGRQTCCWFCKAHNKRGASITQLSSRFLTEEEVIKGPDKQALYLYRYA